MSLQVCKLGEGGKPVVFKNRVVARLTGQAVKSRLGEFPGICATGWKLCQQEVMEEETICRGEQKTKRRIFYPRNYRERSRGVRGRVNDPREAPERLFHGAQKTGFVSEVGDPAQGQGRAGPRGTRRRFSQAGKPRLWFAPSK